MRRVFLDANVYFSGTVNPDGGSGLILRLAGEHRHFELIATDYVIEEALRNLKKKCSPDHARALAQALRSIKPHIHSLKEARQPLTIINEKDVPVLCAAIEAKTEILITLDRKHFLQPEVLSYAREHGLAVQTPKEFLQMITKEDLIANS